MIDKVFTIGGYGFTEATFFGPLVTQNVDLFCDIRARRGMRGSRFAFLNSTRLQERLGSLGIAYVHLKEFAPTTAIRQLQKDVDKQHRVLKHDRGDLGESFVSAYWQEILAAKTLEDFLAKVQADTRRPCLFCVENRAEACHRSLMSEWLAGYSGAQVVHLVP